MKLTRFGDASLHGTATVRKRFGRWLRNPEDRIGRLLSLWSESSQSLIRAGVALAILEGALGCGGARWTIARSALSTRILAERFTRYNRASMPSSRYRNPAGILQVLVFSTALNVVAQPPRPSAGVRPDFEGAWSSATAIPLERPARLKNQPFYTPEQAAQLEKKARSPDDDPLSRLETGSLMLPSLRTSIITDPPNGLLPSLTPAAAAARRDRLERLHNPAAAIDMGLQDRCLLFPTSVPPMIPYRYNSNYQIVQTDDAVVVQSEMIHEARIIRLDRRSHLPSNIRLWLGDSLGHWEGATLVVDTTNFNDAGGFYGDAGGMYGWDRNMHVVERFSLLDANTILYRFEVEDPTAYTQPWKGELTMRRAPNPPFEYACHEGNRDLPNILKLSVSQR